MDSCGGSAEVNQVSDQLDSDAAGVVLVEQGLGPDVPGALHRQQAPVGCALTLPHESQAVVSAQEVRRDVVVEHVLDEIVEEAQRKGSDEVVEWHAAKVSV